MHLVWFCHRRKNGYLTNKSFPSPPSASLFQTYPILFLTSDEKQLILKLLISCMFWTQRLPIKDILSLKYLGKKESLAQRRLNLNHKAPSWYLSISTESTWAFMEGFCHHSCFCNFDHDAERISIWMTFSSSVGMAGHQFEVEQVGLRTDWRHQNPTKIYLETWPTHV